ncbi:hypothetical protein ABEX38_29815 [Priestia megaterium]
MLNKVLVRLRNKKVAMAVVSGILIILVNLGVIDMEFVNHYTTVINTVFGMMVAIGIMADPESHVKE